MKITKEVSQRITKTEVVACQCDMCGATTHKRDVSDREANWWVQKPMGNFSSGEETVTLKYAKVNWGYGCDSGGDGEGIEVDICPNCFLGLLLPWLKSQGVNPKINKYDF